MGFRCLHLKYNDRGQPCQPQQNEFTLEFIYSILEVFFLNCLISSVNERLVEQLSTGSTTSAGSPWVIGMEDVGVKGLASVINACVMTSAFSCGNAFFIVPPGHFIVLHWLVTCHDFYQSV